MRKASVGAVFTGHEKLTFAHSLVWKHVFKVTWFGFFEPADFQFVVKKGVLLVDNFRIISRIPKSILYGNFEAVSRYVLAPHAPEFHEILENFVNFVLFEWS